MKAKYAGGQSISEFIVVMAVLVPLLLTAASFANLLNLSTETVEASRLAAWERTVYKANPLYDFTSEDVEEKIKQNIKQVYLERNYTDFGPGKELRTGVLPSIVDREVDGGQPVSLRVPSAGIAGTGMATGATRLTTKLGFMDGGDSAAAALLSPEVSIAIDEDYSLLKFVSFESYRESSYTSMGVPEDSVAGRNQFNLSGHTALVADGMMPAGGGGFSSHVGDAAFDGVYDSDENSGGLGRFSGGLLGGFRAAGFREAGLAAGDGMSTSSGVGLDAVLPTDL